jgi:hypothetical protein
MKTLIPLTFAAVALTAFSLNVSASDALLTPRAKDTQTKIVAGANNDANLVANRNTSVTPRLLDTQTKKAAGTSQEETNPSLMCARHMTGTPKQISECADHPGAAMPCCVASMK